MTPVVPYCASEAGYSRALAFTASKKAWDVSDVWRTISSFRAGHPPHGTFPPRRTYLCYGSKDIKEMEAESIDLLQPSDGG